MFYSPYEIPLHVRKTIPMQKWQQRSKLEIYKSGKEIEVSKDWIDANPNLLKIADF